MAYVAGNVFQLGVTAQTVSLQAEAPTGGTGPFTYQWYRGPWPGFTPSATFLLTGQTQLAMTDSGLTENTPYYYILAQTDTGNGNLVVNTSPFGAITAVTSAGQGPYTNPSVQMFMWRFDIDFPYGTWNVKNKVRIQDIIRAMSQCNANFRADVWVNQGEYQEAYLQLTAHYLVGIRQAASQGVNAEYEFPHVSKGGLGVSASMQVPTPIQEGAIQATLVKTPYGKAYWEMVRPRVVGTFYTVPNRVSPV